MNVRRIGVVKYLNTIPLIDGLSKVQGLTLLPAVPSRLCEELGEGRVEVALVSIVDAARRGFDLLDCGMIGCDGPTLTVRLFSGDAPGEIDVVHADTDSHTSVALAQVILSRRYGRRVEVRAFDARELHASGGHPRTLLMIGDKVVTDSPAAVRYPHQLDLGEEWHAMTGLPFVYAMWMCRRDLTDAQREDVAVVRALLDRQLRHNLTRLDRLIAERAPEFRWPPDLARHYLGDLLRFRVGERELTSVRRFYDECVELGLMDRAAADRVGVFGSSS